MIIIVFKKPNTVQADKKQSIDKRHQILNILNESLEDFLNLFDFDYLFRYSFSSSKRFVKVNSSGTHSKNQYHILVLHNS